MADHIRIGDVSPRIQYAADGAQTEFAYPFPIFADADLEVFVDADPKESGYAVAGAGESTGGACTFDTAPDDGAVVTLRRRLSIERTADFQESGDFRAKVINDELDRLTAMIQQVADDAGRSLKLSPTDGDATFVLPDKDARKGKVLTFDETTGEPSAVASDAFSGPQGPQGDPGDMAGFNNLSELTDVVTARTNLGLGAAAVADIAAGGTGNLLRADGDGSLLSNLPITNAVDVRLLALKVASIDGDRLNMEDGITDPFGDESDVDTGVSTGGTYDSGGHYYTTSVTGAVLGMTPNLGGSSALSHTMIWRGTAVPNGATVTKIGVYLNNASTIKVKVVERTAAETFTILGSESHSHPGGGWSDRTLVSPITVAASGDFYIGYYVNATEEWNTTILRSYKSGDVTGSAQTGFTEDIGVYPPVRFTYSLTSDMTVVSNVFAADEVPSATRLGLQIERLDNATVGTDLIGEVSRDGGTTWTAATLSLLSTLADGTEYFEDDDIDVSAQPSNTAMKWRVRTDNTRDVRLHGVIFQWRT